ncbi:PucR family transcriptional regulator [Amycolatopsis suaedae]|uniref:PucR family transcriptional regulator n=1 Tax=Amycolatopsis suaedae TaxID=2510978 RepID=A0A4Q7JCK1_9PSEU|nr:PucR family transcriptional regulator [Amycolatopsis suaedae]RZQ64772.1 PucR family transcriptional regulator [Amycolatopsis suaedae]
MTTVRDLLRIPELRLRVRSGDDLLDRGVSRVYGTELPDPSRYLTAGELVLTGLLWWHAPGDAEPFVAALSRGGTAALAASGADTGGIPGELVEACARHRIPLLEVPADLSFAVVTERMVLALAEVRPVLRADTELPVLLTQAAEELAAPCWVLSASGRVVAGSGMLLPDARKLAERFVANGCRAVTARRHSVLPVDDHADVPWAVVVGDDRTTWAPATKHVTDELVDLVRAHQREHLRARTASRAADQAVLDLLVHAGSDGMGPALGRAGWSPDAVARVVLLRMTGTPAVRGVALLDELLSGHHATIGTRGADTIALVEDTDSWPADWAESADRALHTLAPRLRATWIGVGLSGPAGTSGLRGAVDEAGHALAAGEQRGEPVTVTSGDDLGVHRLLLAGVTDQLREALGHRMLGRLIEYDASQQSDLVHTLRVFLHNSGSPTQAAKALHIHVNTLRYRIGRASELIGLDLTDFTNQVDVFLALQLIAGRPEPPRKSHR